MNYKFRIGSTADFVQIHAHPLAIGVDAERNEAVEERKKEINQGKKEAEECGDANQLREKLTRLGREKASRDQPPKTRCAVDSDGASGIVDGKRKFE